MGESCSPRSKGNVILALLNSPAVQGNPGGELTDGLWAVGLASDLPGHCVLCPKKSSVRRGGRGSRAEAEPGSLIGRSLRCQRYRRRPWQIPGACRWSGEGRSRSEASDLHTPALAFPRKATHSPPLAGADLLGNVVEGVHIGSTPQEPFKQNDQENEVDAWQEAQPHICQQKGQVEALWMQREGREGLSLGPAVGRKAGSHPVQWSQSWEVLSRERAGRPRSKSNTQLAYQTLGPRRTFSLLCPSTLNLVGLALFPLYSCRSYSWECYSALPHLGSPSHHSS